MRRTWQSNLVWHALSLAFVCACGSGDVSDLAPTEQEPACDGSGSDLDPCLGPQSTEAAALEVAHQIPGRDLSQRPPLFRGMRVFPVAGSARYARLEVEVGEELPRVLKFVWNDRVNTLRDDGASGDRVRGDRTYTAWIDTAFALEIGLVDSKSIGELEAVTPTAELLRSGIAIPLRDRSALAAAPDVAIEAKALSATALASDQCVGASCVDPEKAFVIRRTGVVNSNRTSDPCLTSATDTTPRVWNFGYLLSKLSGSPSTFAKNWLSAWIGPRTVNGLSVASPTVGGDDGQLHTVPGDLLQGWQTASNSNTLAMSKAPFRLLAIVNRFDLRTNVFFGPNYAGELRFVFTPLSYQLPREPDGSCAVMSVPGLANFPGQDPDTVILEYKVSLSNQAAIRTWATQWRDLGRQAWSTSGELSTYLSKLETITQSIVNKGAGALHRIRTNEATTSFGPWHLREFEIKNGQLVPVTVKQTPDLAGLNESKALAQFILQNYDAILRRDYFDGRALMPDKFPDNLFTFLGAESLNITTSGNDEGTGANRVWQPFAGTLDYTNANDVQARHLFALGTCNGCHGFETRDPSGTPPEFFAHIMPRKRADRSQLSSFLTGVPMGQPLNSNTKVMVPDPMAPGTVRHFNELVSRNQKMADFIDGRAMALAFEPSLSVH